MKECILGFDPGGIGTKRKGNFGWCIVENSHDFPLQIISNGRATNASNAFKEIHNSLHGCKVVGAGIDAPLYWTADGERKSDEAIRNLIPTEKKKSTVQSVNSLQGACLAQGMMIASLLRRKYTNLRITEAHPKAFLKITASTDTITSLVQSKLNNSDDEGLHLRDAALACVAAWYMLHPSDWVNLFELDKDREMFSPVPNVEYWFPIK